MKKKSIVGLCICIVVVFCNGCSSEKKNDKKIEQKSGFSETVLKPVYSETVLCTYKEKNTGVFSHKWVAYIIEPSEKDKDQCYFIELNRKQLGPFKEVSRLFKISPDGEHIAFAAKKDTAWYIFIDGKEKWVHTDLDWQQHYWTPSLDNRTFCFSSAVVLEFSPDGKKIAYPAKTKNGKWAIFVNGIPFTEFTNIGDDLFFVDNTIVYHAWTEDDKIVDVFGDKILGPYESSKKKKISDNGNHYCFTAKSKSNNYLIIDGNENVIEGEISDYQIGSSGQVAYAYKSGRKYIVQFEKITLPKKYDEVAEMIISPDGKHVAFWGREGKKWSLTTDGVIFPGFDGYYFYRSGFQDYSIMWNAESTHLAYFGKKRDKICLFLDSIQISKNIEFPGITFTLFYDDNGNEVGKDLIQGPNVSPQALVKYLCKMDTLKCDPFSTVLFNDELSYIEKDGNGKSYMVIGSKREGPYIDLLSTLLNLPDSKHYCYVILTEKGQQVVIDGSIKPYIYKQVYRPFLSSHETFEHLALKDSLLIHVVHPLL